MKFTINGQPAFSEKHERFLSKLLESKAPEIRAELQRRLVEAIRKGEI